MILGTHAIRTCSSSTTRLPPLPPEPEVHTQPAGNPWLGQQRVTGPDLVTGKGRPRRAARSWRMGRMDLGKGHTAPHLPERVSSQVCSRLEPTPWGQSSSKQSPQHLSSPSSLTLEVSVWDSDPWSLSQGNGQIHTLLYRK